MKVRLEINRWIGGDISLEDAASKASRYQGDAFGTLEALECQVEHLTRVVQQILTPEQIIALLIEQGYVNATLCDLDDKTNGTV